MFSSCIRAAWKIEIVSFSSDFGKRGEGYITVVRVSLKFYRPRERERFVITLDERCDILFLVVEAVLLRKFDTLGPLRRFLGATRWPDNGERVYRTILYTLQIARGHVAHVVRVARRVTRKWRMSFQSTIRLRRLTLPSLAR